MSPWCHSDLLIILHVYGPCKATHCTQHLLVGYFAMIRGFALFSFFSFNTQVAILDTKP